MQQIELSKKEIQNDIEDYNSRIATAQARLIELNHSKLNWHKRNQQRQKLLSEIEHVKQLIIYA